MHGNGYVRTVPAMVALLLAFSALDVWADDGPGFDRPGAGFSPTPLQRGTLAWEQGVPDWTLDHTSGVRASQYTADTLLRLGLGGQLELQAGGSAFNRLSQRGMGMSEVDHGHGDSLLGLKLGLPSPDPAWSLGLLGTLEFNDGARNIREDRRIYALGLTAQQQLDDDHQWNYFAQIKREGRRSEYEAATDYVVDLTPHWGIYGEATALHEDGRSGVQLGNGLTWTPVKRMQFDTYWRRRIAGHATDWEAGLGVSVAFGS